MTLAEIILNPVSRTQYDLGTTITTKTVDLIISQLIPLYKLIPSSFPIKVIRRLENEKEYSKFEVSKAVWHNYDYPEN